MSSDKTSPNLAGGCLLFGSYDNHVYCLDVASGKPRWAAETDGYVHATPALAGDAVVVAGCDGYLRVLELATGKERRKVSLGGYVAASAGGDGGRGFVGTFEKLVLAVDVASGKELWRFAVPARQFPFLASAAITDDAFVSRRRIVSELKLD